MVGRTKIGTFSDKNKRFFLLAEVVVLAVMFCQLRKQSISSHEEIVCSFQVYLEMKFRFRKKISKPPVIFDSSFYVENHRELIAGQDPYRHYCEHGCRLGLDPHPVFSTRYYQDTHLASDYSVNPIEHYLANAKGQPVLDPHPLFDSLSYLQQIESLDSDLTPLGHFQQHNSVNLASSSVFFDTQKYLERYPEVVSSGLTGLYHFLRFGKSQGRFKAVAVNLIQEVMQREQRPAAHQFLGDSQRDISFLASLLGLDRNKPTVVLAAESADFAYAYLLKQISLCYASSYDANVVHLFGRDSEATDEFAPLGPTASRDADPAHPFLELGNQLLFEIVDHVNAIGSVYVATECGPVFDHLVNTPGKFHLLAPSRLSKETSKAIYLNSSKLETIVLPACENGGELANSGHAGITISEFDFEAANYQPVDTSSGTHKPVDLKSAFGMKPEDRLVVGAGDLNLRSGLDRFVATAISYLKASGNTADRFAWFGKLHEQDSEIVQVLMEDLTNANLQDQFLICDETDQFSRGLNSTDAVLLTQRSGCKQSFIADSLAAKTPIVWLAGNPQIEMHFGENDPLRSSDAQTAVGKIASLFSDRTLQAEARKNNSRRAEKLHSVEALVHQLSDQLLLNSIYSGVHQQIASQQDGAVILPFLRSKNRRRVVFTTPTWQISGVNTFIETLVRELNKRDFEASILFTTPYAMTLDKSLLPDVPTKILTTRPDLPPRQLRRLLKSHLEMMAPCVFVPNYDYAASAVSMDLSNNVATLGILHSDDPAHYVHGYRMGPYWDGIVSVSQFIHDSLMSLNPTFADRSSVIHYGIEDAGDVIDPKRESSEKLKVIYTGRIIQEQKRIMDFVDVVNRLAAHSNRFEFSFVGDGDEMNDFWQQMQPHINSGMVKILGRAQPSQIPSLLREAHVFALTSEFEGLPLSLLESLSAGLVPLVTEIKSGVAEILTHEENAMLSPVGDIDTMVANLMKLANDSELFERLSKAARQTLFDKKLVAGDMANQYAEILDRMFNEMETPKESDLSKLIHCPHIERMLNVA